MRYDLLLRFDRPTDRRRLERFFRGRPSYAATKSGAAYQNKDTGVRFDLAFQTSTLQALSGRVGAVRFELNFARPGFYALEADIELTALSAAFPLRVDDPQGADWSDGRYGSKAFLDGWSAGNAWAVGAMLAHDHLTGVRTAPGAMLRDVWDWNYRCAERRRELGATEFISSIRFGLVDGELSRLVIWPMNLRIKLPAVDHVVVTKAIKAEPGDQDAIAAWADLVDAARRSGLDTESPTLDLRDDAALAPLSQLLGALPAFSRRTMQLVAFDKMLDEEVVRAAEARTAQAQLV